MILWLKITKDKYELPLAVADIRKELAEMLGLKDIAVRKTVGRSSYIKVVCPDDEDETENGSSTWK